MEAVELSGLAIHALVEKWNEKFSNAYINQFRSVGSELFLFKIRTKDGIVQWLIELPTLVIEANKQWAPLEKQPNIVNVTKKMFDNQRIKQVYQKGLDRIIVVECGTLNMVIELFGKGNIIVADEHFNILFVRNAHEWKTRTLKMKRTYDFPPGPRAWNALPKNVEDTVKKERFLNVGSWMAQVLGVPSVLISEFCNRSKLEETSEKIPSQEQWNRLKKELEKEFERAGKEKKFVWVENKGKKIIIPKGIVKGKSVENLFGFIEEKMVESFSEEAVETKAEQEKKALEINFERQQKMMNDWKRESEELQKSGEWVYENFALVQGIISAVKTAKKKNLSDKKILEELKKRVPQITNVNTKKETVELEAE
jgi:predicted ribosome quality control (RQC) complex YloA/Tae2 family protein